MKLTKEQKEWWTDTLMTFLNENKGKDPTHDGNFRVNIKTLIREIVTKSKGEGRKEERGNIAKMVAKQIATHSQLEQEWTGVSIGAYYQPELNNINPHKERKEELERLLNNL